jgi:regulator of RNase E activity RraA
MDIQSGDVLHGDRHGVQTIPFEIAANVPAAAQRLKDEELEIIRLSQSDAFTVKKLRSMVDALRLKRKT